MQKVGDLTSEIFYVIFALFAEECLYYKDYYSDPLEDVLNNAINLQNFILYRFYI